MLRILFFTYRVYDELHRMFDEHEHNLNDGIIQWMY
jgi:hypothetical protein